MGADRPWPKSCLATSRPPVSLFTLPSRRNLLSHVWPPHDRRQALSSSVYKLEGTKRTKGFPPGFHSYRNTPPCLVSAGNLPGGQSRVRNLGDAREAWAHTTPGISSGLPWGRAPRGPPAYLPQRRPRKQAQFGWLHAPSPGARLPAAAAPR